MEPFRDDQDLIAELRALRPAPSPDSPPSSTSAPPRASRGARRSHFFAASPLPPRRMASPRRHRARRDRGGNGGRRRQRAGAIGLDGPAHPHRLPLPSGAAAGEPCRPSLKREPSAGQGAGSGGDTAAPHEAAAPSVARNRQGIPAAPPGRRAGPAPPPPPRRPAPSPPAGHRDVERSAEMVLGAEPAEVGGDAAEVFDAVHAANGIVLSSSVSGGAAGDAGASFDLLIPAAKLGDALAAFSAIDRRLAARGDRRHHRADGPRRRTPARLAREDRRPAGPARRRRHDDERAAVEAELRPSAATPPSCARLRPGPPGQLLAGLAADRDRRRREPGRRRLGRRRRPRRRRPHPRHRRRRDHRRPGDPRPPGPDRPARLARQPRPPPPRPRARPRIAQKHPR